ncbi:MAG TPA: hypothetical protein PLG56_13395, partial [Lacunisphaera sp.]|nr:hypothetical protein [Lacunisphaera sp.]
MTGYGTPFLRHLDLLTAGKIRAGDAPGRGEHAADGTLAHNVTAAGAGLGAQVDHVVGGAD